VREGGGVGFLEIGRFYYFLRAFQNHLRLQQEEEKGNQEKKFGKRKKDNLRYKYK
jgi:hypothetical protein